jgi:hypothetical protein
MQSRIPLVVALFAASLSTAAWADFRADFANVQGADNSSLSRIELSGNHMRTDAGNVSMLFDVGSGKMIVLMHDKRQYMDMQKVVDAASAAMSALANLPPQAREMMQQRMGSRMPGMGAPVDVRVTPTGKSESVAGYACQVYSSSISGRHSEDSCLANAADAGISAADQATLRKAFEELKAMTEKMSAGLFKSPLSQVPSDKFPVRIVRFGNDGKAEQTVQLKSLSTGSISTGDFSIPAGYTEQDMGGMGRH